MHLHLLKGVIFICINAIKVRGIQKQMQMLGVDSVFVAPFGLLSR